MFFNDFFLNLKIFDIKNDWDKIKINDLGVIMKTKTGLIKIAMLLSIAISSAVVSATEVKEVMDHTGHEMNTDNQDSNKPMSDYASDYMTVNDTMHKNMTVTDTGNPDAYFVKGMLAHHIGAVEMAEVQLKYGADPKMRALAENIIATQTIEIKEMQDWLAKNDSNNSNAISAEYSNTPDAVSSESEPSPLGSDNDQMMSTDESNAEPIQSSDDPDSTDEPIIEEE